MTLRFLLAAPLLLLVVLFALSNRHSVQVALWPTDLAVETPLALAVLLAAGVAFLIGALVVWIAELGQWRRAREAERRVRVLEDQVQELRGRMTTPPLPPPSG